MTDLQLGLLVIGALAVAGVLVYNRMQERSVRRRAEQAFGSAHADVLLNEPAGRREPILDDRPRQAVPDARVDYIISLQTPPGSAALVLESWASIQRRFGGRAMLAGSDGGWQAALQLVSRSGVIGEAELLEFRSEVETLGARVGGTLAAPEMRQALEAARELDRTCADTDIQVALHVIGIASSVPGDFQEKNFQMTPREDGLTLTLDVALTPEPRRGFEAMARAGLQLASSSGGRLVDDNGKALDEQALAAIGVQLDAVRQMLAERGIEPGSGS